MSTPVGVVLAGGRSVRMGADKALVEVAGTPMARRVADALAAGGCSPVRCQGGDGPALAAIGLAVVPDDRPHDGPLRAIATALRAAAPADVVVSACDLPDLEATIVAAVIRAGHDDPDALLAAAVDDDGPHLVAWWRAAAAGPLGELLDSGERSYRAAFARLHGVAVPVARSAVRNVNRPGDLGAGTVQVPRQHPDDTA